MGGVGSKTPREFNHAALLHVKSITTLSISEIKRLHLWFSKTVPLGYILKDDWKSHFNAAVEPPVEDHVLERLWHVVKERQHESLAGWGGITGDAEEDESIVEGLIPDDDIFDWCDFAVTYSLSLALHFMWDLRFDLMCDTESNTVTRDSLMQFASGVHADITQADKRVRHLFSHAAGPALTRDEFVALFETGPCRDSPELLVASCFGFLPMLSLFFRDASTQLSSDGSACGLLHKRGSSFAWSERRLVVDRGFMFYKLAGAREVKRVVPLEGVSVVRGESEDAENPGASISSFTVTAGTWTREFCASSDLEREAWLHAILANSTNPEDNVYGSFAPPRESVRAKWFVDGKDYFAAVARAITAAKHDVFIAGWAITSTLYLCRDHPPSINNRLDVLLKRKARNGVKVYIMPWNETKVAVELGSELVEKAFDGVENIFVIRHPAVFPIYWTHHQKVVVVDQTVAFVGGIDLTLGRYDTPEHRLDDSCDLATTWPRYDYYQGGQQPFTNSETTSLPLLNRLSVPRMPWHDVAVAVMGDAARDVAHNFIGRWAHHIHDMEISGVPLIVPVKLLAEEEIDTLWPGEDYVVDCHVVRSAGEWSGAYRTEVSLEVAYVRAITNAKSFLYIENQFFCSLLQEGFHNRVGLALLNRLRQAIRNDETFRAIIVLPAHPEGSLMDSSVLMVYRFQAETICRGDSSILGILSEEFPGVDLSQYIFFASLRTWGSLIPDSSAPVVQSMIYVHSKLLIADDSLAVISSANINDRSLVGDRDSEVGVVIQGGETVRARFGGKETLVSRFVHSLRLRLWSEHLGFTRPEALGAIEDPISEGSFELFKHSASENLHIFSEVFGNSIPCDEIRLLSQLDTTRWCQRPGMTPGEARALMEAVVGHLTKFPLRFLEDEDLSPSITTAEAVLEDRIFQ